MRRATRGRLLPYLPTPDHKVSGLGPQASRMDACMSRLFNPVRVLLILYLKDKQAVEAYKADIKAQLTRAGLIRGQPRSSLSRPNPPPMVPPQIRSTTYNRSSIPDTTTSSPHYFDHLDYGHHYVDPLHTRHPTEVQDLNLMPGMSSKPVSESVMSVLSQQQLALNSGFHHQLPDYSDSTLIDLHPPFFYPQSVTPISSSSDSLNLDLSQLAGSQDPRLFEFPPPSPPPPLPFVVGQNNVQDHIIYYFEHVRKTQFIFAGNTLTNATYSVRLSVPCYLFLILKLSSQ